MSKNEKKKVTKKEEKKVEVKKDTKKEEVKIEKKIDYSKVFTKRNAIIVGIIAIIALLGLTLCTIFGGSKKDKVTKSLKNMGNDFYTEYYYVQLSKGRSKDEVAKILERYKKIGIKIDIDNLSLFNSGKYKKDIKEFKKDGYKCDGKNTKVIIYPQKPYGKKDYKLEVLLDCKF